MVVITLQREAKRNAIDRALADALDAALNQLEDSPELRTGVLTGGTQVFSAGSDLASRGDEYGLIRRRRAKPLIAAVKGVALAAAWRSCWPAT